jgi:hypothetical protein
MTNELDHHLALVINTGRPARTEHRAIDGSQSHQERPAIASPRNHSNEGT